MIIKKNTKELRCFNNIFYILNNKSSHHHKKKFVHKKKNTWKRLKMNTFKILSLYKKLMKKREINFKNYI